VTIGVTASFGIAVYSIVEIHSGGRQAAMLATTSFLFTMWLICYYCAVCSSPGYLPYYWAVDRGEVFTYPQQMDGVITTTEQFDFASYNQRPERGSLSKQARRLVLRADHICPWIANWVGLKNYRWFFLKLVWCAIYFTDWLIVLGIDILEVATNKRTNPSFFVMCGAFLPVVGFMGFIVAMLTRHIGYLMSNKTTLQEFKKKRLKDKHNYYDIGCWNNCVSILGPPEYCVCWFFPVPIPRKWGGFHRPTNRPRPSNASDQEE
jgi:hypothetical protein